ncbi:polyisoprenoid-binding protein [Phenylobacterium sp. 20VBR1]|uniref:Polyisoprenoid-binding protein n=1 Tax=Phenylobacterium glaciei TaxID=2803784 RepID=A0A941D2Y0_9CAUL|nr:YceI family protein [Phenylobacterium glaciei]MBR7621171.1 polyisoprenoid-binding protein [Phenylobacterium glaciei]QQZ49832.1 polyisoprenoid-binding protein [Phenylobacterium glaciei]
MIRTALAAAAFSLLAVTGALANPGSQDPAKVPAGNYVLDKRHASLLVKVPHMGGFSKFTMRFDRLDGSFAYEPATWATTKVTITADPTSINTGLPDFDKTIAGPSYFDSAKYPAITFVSTKAEGADGKGTVSGDLTFHGVTKPVVLDVTFNGVGPGMMGAGTRIGFSGTTHLKRSDFGVTTMSQFAGDDLDLLFEVEFVKK